jgi:hypothetical protein
MKATPHVSRFPLLAAFAAIFCVGLAVDDVLGQDAKTTDVPAIKRVIVPSETKLAEILKSEDFLVELPLATVESKLKRLGNAAADSPSVRIVKAVYRAELQGNFLVRGKGQWSLDHPGSVPAVIPLPSLNLALTNVRLNNESAVLGELSPGSYGLLVRTPGPRSVDFEWTARGTPTVQGASFDLRIPSCPLNFFELKVPAEESLIVPKSTGLVSGPHDSGDPKFRVWRLHVAGRTQVEIVVRRGVDAANAPRVFTTIETRVQFSHEQSVYDVDSALEVLHAPVRAIAFEADAALTPLDASSRQGVVQSWKVEPAAARNGRPYSRIVVLFREPLLGGGVNVRLRFSGPRWSEQQSPLPAIDLPGAVTRGETLQLTWAADQHLERWESGGYRLTNAATEADGGQSLTLVGIPSDGSVVRPKFALRAGGAEFSVNQSTRWSLEPGGTTLTSELEYDVSRGQLFSVAARLPKAGTWRVTSVDVVPRDAMQTWSVSGGIVHVDLQRGITPRTDLKLIVQLQNEHDKSASAMQMLDVPDFEPIGAQARQGTFAILAEPYQQISLVQSNQPPVRPDGTLANDARMRFVFAPRQTPVQGKVRLSPQPPVFQAKTRQYVSLSPEIARIKSVLVIEPVVGQPSEVDLYFPGAAEESPRIDVKGAEIVERRRMPWPEAVNAAMRLAAATPVLQAAIASTERRGQVWRIAFREPMTKPITVTTQYDLRAASGRNFEGLVPVLPIDRGMTLLAAAADRSARTDWSLSAVTPLGVERVDGEMIVQPVASSLTLLAARGFEPMGSTAATGTSFSRRYRFGRADLLDSPSLALRLIRRPSDEANHAVIDLLEHLVTVDATGLAVHDLTLNVWNWQGGDLRMSLPPGCHVVSGRLNHIPFDRIAQSPLPAGLEIAIPLLREAGLQTVHVRYHVATRAWMGSLGRNIGLSSPRLPLMPLRVEREIRLAPQWLPLWQEELSSFDERPPGREAMRSVWRIGESLLNELSPIAPDDSDQDRLALQASEAALRRSGPREITLGEAISRLSIDRARESAVPLVIDRAAARILGLTAKTWIANPSDGPVLWNRLGLTVVHVRSGAVLTTPYLAVGLREAERRAAASPQSAVAAAVEQALAFGQDASGRFVSVDSWAIVDPLARVSSESATLRDDQPVTVWKPRFGGFGGEELVILRPSHIRGLAIAFAIALFGIGLIIRRIVSKPWFFGFVAIGICLALPALSEAPRSCRELALGPLVALAGLLVLAYRGLLGQPIRPNAAASAISSRAGKATLAGLIAFAIVSAAAWGQDAAIRVLYILETPLEPARAFVRPETLRWLDDLEKSARPKIESTVVISARYSARAETDGLRVDGEFEVDTLAADAVATLPLVGVDLLEGSELDGRPAFPIVGPKGGYQIAIADPGLHRIRLKFLARPNALGDVSWTGPTTFCTSLHVVAPAKLRTLRLGKGLGAESLTRDGGEQILEADLGREPAVTIHGLGSAPVSTAASLSVRELYSWDLRPANRSLQATLAYTAVGEIRSIEIALPANVEARTVELSDPARATSAASEKNVIKNWRIVPRDGGRVLQIEFLRPMNGPFQIASNLTLQGAANGNQFDLRLPLPLKAATSDGSLAFRIEGAEAAVKAQSVGVAAIPPDVFAKEWLKVSQREIAVPQSAYSFARAAKNAAAATLEVVLTPIRPRVQHEMALTVLPQAIDVESRLSIAAADDRILLNLAIPENLTLREVQGSDVHHWSRQAGQLHVWLVGPRKKTSIAILGWIPNTTPNSKAVKIPPVQLESALVETAQLTLGSVTGVALEPKDVALVEETLGDARIRRFRSANGALPSEYRVRSQSAEAEFAALTTAEASLGRCVVSIHLRGRAAHAGFPETQVRVTRWPGPTPQLISSIAGLKVAHVRNGDEHIWTLSAPAGTPQQIDIAIKETIPFPAGAWIELPEVRIERGGVLTEPVVAIAGAQAAESAALKFATVRSSTKELLPWPIELGRLRAAGSQFARRPLGSPPIRVQATESVLAPSAIILDAKHRVTVSGGDRWLHQMEWTVWSKAGLDLEIALPEAAKLVAAAVDDLPVSPRQTGPEALALTLAPSLRMRTVVLSWMYPPELEPLTRPRMKPARLRDLDPPEIHESLFVPMGWALDKPLPLDRGIEPILRDMKFNLASLRLLGDELALAGKSGQPALVQTLQQFASLDRQAQYRLRVGEFDAPIRDELEASLKSTVDDWQKTAKALGLDSARVAAEKTPWLAPVRSWPLAATSGLPYSHVRSADAGDGAILLSRQPRSALQLPIAVIIVIIVLCLWPALLRLWVGMWPEQLAAVALAALVVDGPSLVGGALLLIAVAGRAVTIVAALRRWLRRRRLAVAL